MQERIGPYRIVRPVGVGGMGEVFEAIDDRLQRRVAIKVLRPELSADPEVAARFLNEARAVNIVRHPSLVEIWEHSRLADGTLYIVMEFLDGESLAARMRRAHLAPALIVRIARQIAAALAAAHARGIVHRDLKPDNVMLVDDPELDSGLRAKVLDFGIARVVGTPGQTALRLTRAGLVMGTPRYISPEQCLGSIDVDGKADVYALGVLLFEALAGAPPFSAVNELELLAMHVQTAAPPLPSTVVPELAALVAAMLAKDPARRPSMADVMAQLSALSVLSRVPRIAAPAARAGVARRAIVVMLACAALSALVTSVLLRLRDPATAAALAPAAAVTVPVPRAATAPARPATTTTTTATTVTRPRRVKSEAKPAGDDDDVPLVH